MNSRRPCGQRDSAALRAALSCSGGGPELPSPVGSWPSPKRGRRRARGLPRSALLLRALRGAGSAGPASPVAGWRCCLPPLWAWPSAAQRAAAGAGCWPQRCRRERGGRLEPRRALLPRQLRGRLRSRRRLALRTWEIVRAAVTCDLGGLVICRLRMSETGPSSPASVVSWEVISDDGESSGSAGAAPAGSSVTAASGPAAAATGVGDAEQQSGPCTAVVPLDSIVVIDIAGVVRDLQTLTVSSPGVTQAAGASSSSRSSCAATAPSRPTAVSGGHLPEASSSSGRGQEVAARGRAAQSARSKASAEQRFAPTGSVPSGSGTSPWVAAQRAVALQRAQAAGESAAEKLTGLRARQLPLPPPPPGHENKSWIGIVRCAPQTIRLLGDVWGIVSGGWHSAAGYVCVRGAAEGSSIFAGFSSAAEAEVYVAAARRERPVPVLAARPVAGGRR